jgi:branched-chain amino acid transport system permease protein
MDYIIHIAMLIVIYSLFSASLNLELGYAGLYNFGHIAFFAIGAYTTALLSLAGVPVLLAMSAGMITAAMAGWALSFPALRLSGDYFGVATLVFAEMTRLVFLNERWLTKGPMGLPGIPRPEAAGWGAEGAPQFFLLSLILVGVGFAFLSRIIHSPFGRALKVVREDPFVAQAFGKDVVSLQRRAMVIGSGLAGLAGVLYAHYISYISPADFTLTETILVLLCVIVGGRGTLSGNVVGSALMILLAESIRFLPIPETWFRIVAPLQGMSYGLLLLIMIRVRPQGIIAESGSRMPHA